MRSFHSIATLALFGALAFQADAVAQTAPAPAAPTIALVDIQRVVSDSSAGKSMLSQLDGERKKIRDQLAKLEEDLKNSDNELRRQRSILAEQAFNEQAQQLQRKAADGQRFQQERQEAFNKGASDAQNVIFDNMRDVVQQISGERKIGLVLRKEVVLNIIDKNMDITDDVIQRLNTKLPSVTVTVAAPGAAPSATAAGPRAPGPLAAPAAAKK